MFDSLHAVLLDASDSGKSVPVLVSARLIYWRIT